MPTANTVETLIQQRALRPLDAADLMTAHPVSTGVSNAGNEGEELIEPVGA